MTPPETNKTKAKMTSFEKEARVNFAAKLISPALGPAVGRAIVRHFLDLDTLSTMTEEQLLRISGIGPKSAKMIRKALDEYIKEKTPE